ncbi:MAG: penicillin-binding transpeptidase domain-containing protein, partial [Verrucomicrobiota bacterium]
TLDMKLQRICERMVSAYVKRREVDGIENACVLLLDTKSMALRAGVGSADFFNDSIQGQVNGLKMKRSPGSALKPFIYGLAIDAGLIHPELGLKDTPMSFAGYQPTNYDGGYAGWLSATNALVESRNVPAVYLGSQLGEAHVYSFLQDAGISRLRESSYYGLTLPLGSSEVSPFELGELYALLANGGEIQDIRVIESAQPHKGARLMSGEAAFLVLDMLQQAQPPQVFQDYSGARTRNLDGVAWKTGTSWGFRDGWSVGVFDDYVMVVWVGNFAGEGHESLNGRHGAGPLFFSLVEALRNQNPLVRSNPFKPDPQLNLRPAKLCAVSGAIPNQHCSDVIDGWFIPGVSPISKCEIHRIDPACDGACCVSECFPEDVQAVFIQNGKPGSVSNAIVFNTDSWIQSPQGGEQFILQRDSSKNAVILRTWLDQESRVQWYANSVFIGHSDSNGNLKWSPKNAGTYQIMAKGASGKIDQVRVKVLDMID